LKRLARDQRGKTQTCSATYDFGRHQQLTNSPFGTLFAGRSKTIIYYIDLFCHFRAVADTNQILEDSQPAYGLPVHEAVVSPFFCRLFATAPAVPGEIPTLGYPVITRIIE